MIISDNKAIKYNNRNKKYKEPEIDPKYKNLVYGFNIKDATNLREIDTIYNKAMTFKSTKAKKDILCALKKQVIKLKLITDKRLLASYLRINND